MADRDAENGLVRNMQIIDVMIKMMLEQLSIQNFCPQPTHRTILFCFCGLVQSSVTKAMHIWNHHTTIKIRCSESLPGKPSLLYYAPLTVGESEMKKYTNTDIDVLEKDVCKLPPLFWCSDEFAVWRLFLLCWELNRSLPTDVSTAMTLFVKMRDYVRMIVNQY